MEKHRHEYTFKETSKIQILDKAENEGIFDNFF